MKKFLMPMLAILFLIACEKESVSELVLDQATYEEGALTARNSNKISVCHKGKIINININGTADHQAHGDAVDMDGDGYFDIDNACGETDCDDNDPNIGTCPLPTITWSGPRTQCNTILEVTALVGVPSFIRLCQSNDDVAEFSLSTRSYNQDFDCFGGYSSVSGTVTVEQNGVVVEADFVDNVRGRGEAVFTTPFNIDNGPITATLTSGSADNFICD